MHTIMFLNDLSSLQKSFVWKFCVKKTFEAEIYYCMTNDFT